jgi:predicted dinucleotide-binding enzyme
MKIGILGTGGVGRVLATKLASLGHSIVIGTRDVNETMARKLPNAFGTPPFLQWQELNREVKLAPLAEAAKHGELVINALTGAGALAGLRVAGADNLRGKILIDASNPLDHSNGTLSLFVSNTDSLGEQIQREFPGVRVVKSLNTVTAHLLAEPAKVGDGTHTVFVSGNDPDAKRQVTRILKEWLGWKDVIDLGDISTARAAEMLLPLWARVRDAIKTPIFAFRVVR